MGWSLQAANDCLPLWCILRSPKHWSWISCWNFVNFLPHHLLYLPESKKIILCATLYWDLYQRKELAAPTNTQHLKGITGLQTGLLDKNTRQSCIFLALMPNLKFDAVKTWQFLSDAPRTTQILDSQESSHLTSSQGFCKLPRWGLHTQTETNALTSIYTLREAENTWNHFSGTIHCIEELTEEPNTSNSFLAYHLPVRRCCLLAVHKTRTDRFKQWRRLQAFSKLVPFEQQHTL